MDQPNTPATPTITAGTHLLRPVDVATALNISKSLAYRLLQSGQIPTVRFNRTVRVRLEDIEAFILKNMDFGVSHE